MKEALPEKTRVYKHEWYERNKARIKAKRPTMKNKEGKIVRAWGLNENNSTLRWRREHPEKLAEYTLRQRAKCHKITYEQYLEILAGQNNACAICELKIEQSTRRLCIDHDHACCSSGQKSCGKCIRGLLCNKCNRGLGYFNDRPELLMKAANYLLERSVTKTNVSKMS